MTAPNRAKRSALDAWVKGVNAKGGFGVWCWQAAFNESQIHDIIARHANADDGPGGSRRRAKV